VAKPKLPTSLRIGHLTYTVKPDNKGAEDRGVAGDSNPYDCLIRIRTDYAPDAIADTLLHEVLHQCLAASGVVTKGKDADTEERWVAAITGPLLTALRANPDLVSFLLAGA
jgi:hypothetical protein